MSETQKLNLSLEKITFVNKISLLLRATSDDDHPIQGYMYKEISNITHESDGYCESLLEYLVDRLEKNSCHVKLKVLKLMKHTLENGHKNFRLGLLKSCEGITSATKFSGTPDPLHGNVPYIFVRKTAKELLELLFDTEGVGTDEHRTEETEASDYKSITGSGIGSSAYGENCQQRGFGKFPLQKNKSLGESIIDSVSKFAEKLSEPPEDPHENILSSIQNVGIYRPPSSYGIPHVTSHSQTSHVQVKPRKKNTTKHVPGKAGGGWDDEDEDGELHLQGSTGQSSEQLSALSNNSSDRMDNVMMEDWTAEESLVSNTLENRQVFLLTRPEIRSFLKSCSDLNCDKIVEILNHRMNSSNSNQIMRSLLLVENLLTTDLINIERVAAELARNLVNLMKARDGPIASKAKKIVKIIDKLSNINLLAPDLGGCDTSFSQVEEREGEFLLMFHSETAESKYCNNTKTCPDKI